MKKSKLFLFILSLCLLFSGCARKDPPVTEGSEAFTPLFRFTVAQGKGEETRLFYLPDSDGFIYLHPASEGGFLGGFVSPSRSVSSESVVKGTSLLTFAKVLETGEDRALLLTDDGLTHTLLKENGSQTVPFPEKGSFDGALFFDELSVIGETEELILLYPIDFSETYVLAKKDLLTDFSSLLAVTHNGQRIWYTKKGSDGKFSGIAFFEYGKNVPLGTENFSFDTASPIGERGVLFTRNLEDGGVLYTFRDLETGKASSLMLSSPFDGVICDPGGKVLCGTEKKDVGGAVHIYDFENGKEAGIYSIEQGSPNPSLAIDNKGENLLFAVSLDTDEILGVLDLNHYLK